ncbi:DUF3967 domain-containing protein (plasmid) [Sutcliffiella horikoshii]|uniref:DUF3967 domain-containing protein n=1 Tax=Sutcliffiella horikoshii TaxID=79883 RepID=UPI001CBF536C|nr:DUF3967 domain-containing protein [Sutcliffiella horikoshii]UAL49736.1 DUF3967 domain-containing protein [Sutcliffiella horikoshii]
MDKYKRASEVAEQLIINRNTLRRWLLQYEDYLNTKLEGNTKFIHESSIPAIQLIKDCYAKQLQEHEIKDKLAKSHEIPKNAEAEEEEKTPGPQYEQELNEIKSLLQQQQEFNKQLVERLNEQQKYIESRMDARDKNLMSMIREVQETKQQLLETAAAKEEVKEEEKEQKTWWSKLFGN